MHARAKVPGIHTLHLSFVSATVKWPEDSDMKEGGFKGFGATFFRQPITDKIVSFFPSFTIENYNKEWKERFYYNQGRNWYDRNWEYDFLSLNVFYNIGVEGKKVIPDYKLPFDTYAFGGVGWIISIDLAESHGSLHLTQLGFELGIGSRFYLPDHDKFGVGIFISYKNCVHDFGLGLAHDQHNKFTYGMLRFGLTLSMGPGKNVDTQ